MKKDILAITSLSIALIALAVILSVLIVNFPSKKASVQNIIEPLTNYSSSNYQPGTTIIQIEKSDSGSSSGKNHAPEINLGSTIYMQEGETLTLNMDYYASDDEDSHSELEYEIISPSNSSVILAEYNSSTREVTITAVGSAGESETLAIKVTDTEGDSDSDSVIIEITENSGNSNAPIIANIPDVFMLEDGTAYLPQSLNEYVADQDNADDEITWTVSGNTNVIVDINPATKNVTFTANPEWSGTEWITFRAEDPDGNYDTEVIMVEVTPVDDDAVWNALESQSINEDSASGTIVYLNIVGQASDIDSPLNVSVVSTSSHYDLNIIGNDLVISNLEANWYGSETVVLDCNGVTATFTLNVIQLYDDCIEVCGYISCEEVCD